MLDIELWLKSIGLEKYADVFARHDIDLDVALGLSEQDLEKLGLSLGHCRKFLAAVAKLRTGGAQTQADAPRLEAAVVERRQVTVVFTDLVGSTALASQLDPEDMDCLLQEYRKVCAAVVSRYDGHVAQYLGDGIVAFFGFPAAQEHAAERAVRAGLEIAAAVGRLKRPDGEALQSRVGIATGLVAAGTAGVLGEQTVVGDAPNLAARLQSFAEPGCVLVGPATHRLTEAFSSTYLLASMRSKDIASPSRCGKCSAKSPSRAASFLRAPRVQTRSSDGNARRHSWSMLGSALRTEMATLLCSRARPGSVSHGSWKRS